MHDHNWNHQSTYQIKIIVIVNACLINATSCIYNCRPTAKETLCTLAARYLLLVFRINKVCAYLCSCVHRARDKSIIDSGTTCRGSWWGQFLSGPLSSYDTDDSFYYTYIRMPNANKLNPNAKILPNIKVFLATTVY